MKQTEYWFLRDSKELGEAIDRYGSLEVISNPRVRFVRPPHFEEELSKGMLSEHNIAGINGFRVALSCEYEHGDSRSTEEEVHQLIKTAATALQLVKPTPSFGAYWIVVGEDRIRRASADTRVLPAMMPASYLRYQQHHILSEGDAKRAINLLPALMPVLAPCAEGSWKHPLASIHRAV